MTCPQRALTTGPLALEDRKLRFLEVRRPWRLEASTLRAKPGPQAGLPAVFKRSGPQAKRSSNAAILKQPKAAVLKR